MSCSGGGLEDKSAERNVSRGSLGRCISEGNIDSVRNWAPGCVCGQREQCLGDKTPLPGGCLCEDLNSFKGRVSKLRGFPVPRKQLSRRVVLFQQGLSL